MPTVPVCRFRAMCNLRICRKGRRDRLCRCTRSCRFHLLCSEFPFRKVLFLSDLQFFPCFLSLLRRCVMFVYTSCAALSCSQIPDSSASLTGSAFTALHILKYSDASSFLFSFKICPKTCGGIFVTLATYVCLIPRFFMYVFNVLPSILSVSFLCFTNQRIVDICNIHDVSLIVNT